MSHNEIQRSLIPESIFLHKKLLLWTFFGVVALTAVVTLVMPKQYRSEMKIQVQNNRETQAVSSDSGAQHEAGAQSEDLLESQVNSEVELLSGNDIMEHLVTFRSKHLGEQNPPAVGSKEMAKAVKKLSKVLEINPVRKSSIIDITYTDETPELAQAVMQELQKEYLSKHVMLRRPAGTSEFFASETKAATDKLKVAEQELSEFQAKNDFVSLAKEKELLAYNLDHAKSAVLGDNVEVHTLTQQISDLRQRLATTPKRISTLQRSLPNQYVMQQLTANLSELKNRRIALAERYQPTDRLMVEINAQIDSTQKTLDYLNANNAVEKSDDNDPAWLAMDLQYKTQQVALAGATARLAQHKSQLLQYQSRLDELEQLTPTNDALEQRVSELQNSQQLLIEKRDAAMVDDMLDAKRFGNVAVALAPTFSRMYVKPVPLLNAALGLLSALILCVALITILESTRQTILSPAELEATSGIPVLATVPDIRDLGSMAGLPARTRTAAL